MSIQTLIEQSLTERFSPSLLDVENESHQHAGGAGRESHFRCVIVSDAFEGQPLIARHRAVHEALKEALARGVHALSIHAHSEAEWSARGGRALASPPCAGGSSATAS